MTIKKRNYLVETVVLKYITPPYSNNLSTSVRPYVCYGPSVISNKSTKAGPLGASELYKTSGTIG